MTSTATELRPGSGGSATGRTVAAVGSTWLRRGAVVAVVVVAVVAGVGRSHDLAAAGHSLAHVRWGLLLVALGLESVSMVVFARIQQRLLRAGNVDVGLGPMTAITLAGNALALTLPGGVAWGATWVFRRLRRHGADRLLAGWVVLVAGALGSFALFLVVAAGIEIAGDRGPVADLRGAAAALTAIPVVAAGAVLVWRRSSRARTAGRKLGRAVSGAPRLRHVADAASTLATRVGAVGLDARGWAATGALAALNWLVDCACLVTCVWAISGTVPWRGVLVAYGVAQVAASIPVVPGGLGVVEGSLSLLLVAYGMPADSALAGVFVYRIVSFWSVVPVGWVIVAFDQRVRVPWPTLVPSLAGALRSTGGAARVPPSPCGTGRDLSASAAGTS